MGSCLQRRMIWFVSNSHEFDEIDEVIEENADKYPAIKSDNADVFTQKL